MGLLDDAIREHLELKRLRGADPSEVARLEQEVLGAVRETQKPGGDQARPVTSVGQPVGEEAQGAGEPVAAETVEIDMRSILNHGTTGDDQTPDHPSDTSDDEEALSGHEQAEDVLEEIPDFLQETPEHERLWFEQQPPRDFDFDK